MLIDFHTHIMPDKIAHNAIMHLRDNIMNNLELDAEPDEAFPLCGDATYEGTIKVMDERGIDKCVLLPIATNEKQSANVNNYAEQINGDRIISFGSVHPFQKDWEYVLEDLCDRGFKGIKLHPEFQQFYIDGKEGMRVLKKADRLGLIISVHAGEDPGYKPPYHSSPERFANVIGEIDGSRLIAAHLGGMWQWDDVEKHLVGTDILMDTSYISNDIDFVQYKRIITNHGADKILFGSDCPWQDPGRAYRDLCSLGLDDESLEMIKSGNAMRLLA